MLIQKVQSDRTYAFLNILGGGVGLRSGEMYAQRFRADAEPFPQVTVNIDTEPVTAEYVDTPILIPLDAGKIKAMQADPDRFGGDAKTIIDNHAKYLNPEDIQNGSRTIRLLTQLAWIFHYWTIAGKLRTALHALLKKGRIDCVIPTIVSSSGGGTGSALQVLLLYAFLDLEFRKFLTEGMGDEVLHTPLSFVVEPFALAHTHNRLHASKIMANAFAFRIESDLLERQHASKYIIHVGFANTKGTILCDPVHIARVLGTSVYEFQRSWPELKPRLVDGPDVTALGSGYAGHDTPEFHFPQLADMHQSRDNGNGQCRFC